MTLAATAWEDLLPIWVILGLLGIFLFVRCFVIEVVIRGLFPCASGGPILHHCRQVGPEGVVGQTRCLCGRCGASWVLEDKCYSIASQGDPDSYLSVWRREDHGPPGGDGRCGMDDVD